MELWAKYSPAIIKRKKVIALFVLVATISTAVYSLVLPKYYKVEAVLLPVPGNGGGGLSSMLGQLGGMASLAGLDDFPFLNLCFPYARCSCIRRSP